MVETHAAGNGHIAGLFRFGEHGGVCFTTVEQFIVAQSGRSEVDDVVAILQKSADMAESWTFDHNEVFHIPLAIGESDGKAVCGSQRKKSRYN